ncbi:hypothetical protein LRQ08_21725 [Rhodococcus qingshengii]|uniref:hypothetical protein n=1 Tax=Rhodococcus qingshengii TaxID=334542 RepID=UPI002112893E|nr:hypothetical protein [Rhodococcus qingshengii]UUE23849.1 hypothetical protein LRQ08_21725 [Rhodococcus qingshengii]
MGDFAVIYAGTRFELTDADAVNKLEEDLVSLFAGSRGEGGCQAGIVGIVTPSGVVRLHVSAHIPIALIGGDKGNPTMISGW